MVSFLTLNTCGVRADNLMDFRLVVLLGRPGAGKGTLATSYKFKDKYIHLSVGDLMRDLVKSGDPTVKIHKENIEKPTSLLPSCIVEQLIEKHLEIYINAGNKVILDGFPRTREQLNFLLSFLKKKGVLHTVTFIHVKIPEDLVYERVEGRKSCEICGRIYHTHFVTSSKNKKCDACGGLLKKRLSDNKEDIKARLKTYNETLSQVIDVLEKRGCLEVLDGTKEIPFCRFSLETILHRKGIS